MTEFENAAFAVFIILMSRALSDSDLNLYIPLSKVDENMRRAHERNAVLGQKFYFRQYVTKDNKSETDDAYTEMSIDEIINGKVIISFNHFKLSFQKY